MAQIWYILLILLLSNSVLYTQEPILPKTIYFNEYVDSVLIKLPDIQLNKLKYTQSQVNQMKALKQKEWIFEIRSGVFQESDFTGNIDSPFVFQTGWEFASSLQKTFVNIGGRMNLDFIYRQFAARGVVDGITEERDFFVPTLTFQYVQPLLKNAFGILDRIPIALAGLESKITDWSIEEENSYLLSNYKKLYMQWVVYGQIYDFLQESYNNAIELERISINQQRTGFIDGVDLQNTKILLLEIENEILDVENAYTNLQQQISFLVGDTNIQPDPNEWDLFNNILNNESFDALSFEDTRQSLILEFMNDKLKHSGRALRNSRFPELNLLLTAAMEVYSTNSTSQVNEILIVPAYYAGLQLKYSFGDIDYKANLLEYQKSSLEYQYLLEKYADDYHYKMQDKKRKLTFYREKINNKQQINGALQKRYNVQYQKFTQGREVLASLVDTRNQMLKNRIAESDIQMRLIFEYFDFLVMNNQDEIALGANSVE